MVFSQYDLRLGDHAGIDAARAAATLDLAFVFDRERLASMSAREVQLLYAAVEALRDDVARRYGQKRLHVLVGDTEEVIASLAQALDTETVILHTDPTSVESDKRVIRVLRSCGLEVNWWSDGLTELDDAIVQCGADFKRFVAMNGRESLVSSDRLIARPAPEILPESAAKTHQNSCECNTFPSMETILELWQKTRDVDTTSEEGTEIWMPAVKAGEAHALKLLEDAVHLDEAEFRSRHLPLLDAETGHESLEHVAMSRVLAAGAFKCPIFIRRAS